MIRLEHALAAGALACVGVAAVVPPAFDLVEISLGDRPGLVHIDDLDVEVRVPASYESRRSFQDDALYVRLDYRDRDGGEELFVAFVQGGGPDGLRVVDERDGRPIERTETGVKWEVSDDATVLVTSTDSLDLAVDVVERLEIAR